MVIRYPATITVMKLLARLVALIITVLAFLFLIAPEAFAETGLYWSNPPSMWKTCGLRIEPTDLPVQSYNSSTGTYLITYHLTNTTGTSLSAVLRTWQCRCAENDGNFPPASSGRWSTTDASLPPSPACIGNYPTSETCTSADETVAFAPGETKTKTLSVSTPSSITTKNCGSFQADVTLVSVNGDSTCKAQPLAYGYHFSKLSGGLDCLSAGSPPSTGNPPGDQASPPGTDSPPTGTASPPPSRTTYNKCDVTLRQCVPRYVNTTEKDCNPLLINVCKEASPPPTGMPFVSLIMATGLGILLILSLRMVW